VSLWTEIKTSENLEDLEVKMEPALEDANKYINMIYQLVY
jgi:hypothetical protein